MMILFYALIPIFFLSPLADGRMDEDTEKINTSFKDQVSPEVHMEDQKCRVWVNGRRVNVTAKMDPPFKMPTCLKVLIIIYNVKKNF